MPLDENDDHRTYVVLINGEEQYSLWLQGTKIPPGWRHAGKTGLIEECSQYVDQVWTDMRPLSLRKHMDQTVRDNAERS